MVLHAKDRLVFNRGQSIREDRGVPYLGLLIMLLWVFCLIDVITADEGGIRHLPKMVWLLLVVFFRSRGRSRGCSRDGPSTVASGVAPGVVVGRGPRSPSTTRSRVEPSRPIPRPTRSSSGSAERAPRSSAAGQKTRKHACARKYMVGHVFPRTCGEAAGSV